MVYSCYASLVYSMLGVTTHEHGESRFIYNPWSKKTWQQNSTKDGGCLVAMKYISANTKRRIETPTSNVPPYCSKNIILRIQRSLYSMKPNSKNIENSWLQHEVSFWGQNASFHMFFCCWFQGSGYKIPHPFKWLQWRWLLSGFLWVVSFVGMDGENQIHNAYLYTEVVTVVFVCTYM